MTGWTVADKLWQTDIIMTKTGYSAYFKQIAMYFLLVKHDCSHSDIKRIILVSLNRQKIKLWVQSAAAKPKKGERLFSMKIIS